MLDKILKDNFKLNEFRQGQREIVEAVASGADVVALMPTGGGKSLCYQLPALVNKNLTIVISPLIALMKDQVDSLRVRGISAAFINSSLAEHEIYRILNQARDGQLKLLYIAPERFKSGRFVEIFRDLEVDFVAIDEAHCVSQWGHDFRPDYMKIKDFIAGLARRPSVAAFTATATNEVRDDIIKNLDLRNPQVFVRGFDRPNLIFMVRKELKDDEREREACKIISKMEGSGIVYSLTRKRSEQIAQYLRNNGISAIAYHAGMSNYERERVQNDFMENKYRVIVATIAFGMGVNKADIRFVIHLGMPGSLENYYQEAGRAGRDGERAYCVLLAAKKDNSLHSFFINESQDEMREHGNSPDEIAQIIRLKYDKLEKMKQYVNADNCRRKLILQYFNDPDIHKYNGNCKGCDVCLDYKWEKEPVDPRKEKEKRKGKIENSDTIKTSVDFYNQGYTVEQIAKLRELGQSTIMGHLVRWYSVGGLIDIDKLINPEQEKLILAVMSEIGEQEKLSPIKAQLPEDISYEQIRLVMAKRRRGK